MFSLNLSLQDWNRQAQLEREDEECGLRERKCDNCSRIFKREKDFKYHVKLCESCCCKTCSKSFKNKEHLQKHEKIHAKSHHCSECNKSFATSYDLKKHKSSHLGVVFGCPACGKQFSNNSNMKKHLKNIHT